MNIDINEITGTDKWIGKKLWICDYRQEDINKKPIRHQRPTEVIVRSISELPKNKKVYYTKNFFSKLNNKGEFINSSIIPVFDNTGYRSMTGIPLAAFDNEEECKMHYSEQVDKIIKMIDNEMESILLNLQNMKKEAILEKSKYL